MAAAEERLAAVEVRVAEHAQQFVDFREEGRLTRQLIDTRFAAIDGRFAALDGRFASIDARFTSLDQKIDQGVAMLRREMSTDFRWLVGIMLATMASLAGTVIGVALSR